MMTLEKMIVTVEALGNDASYYWWEEEHELSVTLDDFEGFDENWSEIYREYDNPETVKRFERMLETECRSKEDDFYVTYHFEDFDVQLGYSSFDI